MPWIIIYANGEELDRRDLVAPVVIGRSPECDIPVRDILLSRTHCRIERSADGGWKVTDLDSKNGTRLGWQGIKSHALRDGDHLRMGRTRVLFHTGPFEAAGEKRPPRTDRLVRPADPHEALSGTVTDFIFVEEEHDEHADDHVPGPFPQPRAFDPAAQHGGSTPLGQEDVASSFWCREGEGSDSAPETSGAPQVRVTTRALPRIKPIYREIRRTSETDLSLQVDAVPETPAAMQAPVVSTRRRRLAVAGVVLGGVMATAIAMMSIWLLTLAN